MLKIIKILKLILYDFLIKFLNMILIIFFLYDPTLAQEKETPVWPYGGTEIPERQAEWMKTVDSSKWLDLQEKQILKRRILLNFNHSVNFANTTFTDTVNFYRAKFHNSVDFSRTEFHRRANFVKAEFDSSTSFHKAKFFSFVEFYMQLSSGGTRIIDPEDSTSFDDAKIDTSKNFHRAKFFSSVDFSEVTFSWFANFVGTAFHKLADFREATFNHEAWFDHAQFFNLANFREATFLKSAAFDQTIFEGKANFRSTTFFESVCFVGTSFNSLTNFRGAIFKEKPEFFTIYSNGKIEHSVFKGELNLRDVHFEKGTDFTKANLDSLHTIYLFNTRYPEGQLKLNWKQFQAKDDLRIKAQFNKEDSIAAIKNNEKIDTTQAIQQERYRRIKEIYHKLRDNFLAQDNEASADAVMYELGRQRQEILNEKWAGILYWKIYGWIWGWGHKPWRFLMFIVLPVLLLSARLWYLKYYI